MKSTLGECWPIDIESEIADNELSLPQDSLLSVAQIYSMAPDALKDSLMARTKDERSLYLPFYDTYLTDGRKGEIARGLGGLGLVALQVKDFKRMTEANKRSYAANLLDYDEHLDRGGRLLRFEDQIKHPDLQAKYPGADQRWANQYADELFDLKLVLGVSDVFQEIKAWDHNDPGVERLRSRLPKHRIEVYRDEKGKLITATPRPVKIPHQRRAA